MLITHLNGIEYAGMVSSGAHALQRRRDEIDHLNVYPVPDGDTGSNMSMTVSPIDTLAYPDPSLEAVSAKIASQFLRSARGNSGVILSLFFRGVSRGFKGLQEADAGEIQAAFQCGVEEAYKAVQDPKEGTILTVMRVSASVPHDGDDLAEFFRLMLDSAAETLEKTPDLLPVLKQAGVVDSGGTGYTEILSGMVAYLEGCPVPAEQAGERKAEPEGADFASFDTESIINPYCTECIITKKDNLSDRDVEALRVFVLAAGDSAVFADDAEIIKIHVHTKDPGRVLSRALKCGSLLTVKVENMKNQHTHLAGGTEQPEQTPEKAPEEEPAPAPAAPDQDYGFVAVTMGDGIRAAFKDFGVGTFVTGGQTMNPSTSQLLDAALGTPAKTVYLLPNNGNVCLVAQQAAQMVSDRKVVVIPTLSVPMGLSALMAFDPEADEETNTKAMKEAIRSVRTLEITFAAHDATVNGKNVKKDQILGLLNHKVVQVTDSIPDCLRALLQAVLDAGGADFLTVFYGQDVPETEAKEAESVIRSLFPRTDIALLPGGQPLYYYIISAE